VQLDSVLPTLIPGLPPPGEALPTELALDEIDRVLRSLQDLR
jgi:hypothetical protein